MIRILKVFLRHSFSLIIYAITVIFICLLRDKASNAEFFQIFPCKLYHTYSTFRLLSLKTKRTIAYSNPTASCLSPRLKSTGNNLGETKVFNAVRRGFPEVKPQFDRGKITANGSIVSGGTVGYVAEIFNTLVMTPRGDELKAQVPQPIHSMLRDKESIADAKEKFLHRKNKETTICPPTMHIAS